MLSELVRGMIPKGWRRYTVPAGCTVIQWITDFSTRIQQLQKVSKLVSQAGAKELQVMFFFFIILHLRPLYNHFIFYRVSQYGLVVY